MGVANDCADGREGEAVGGFAAMVREETIVEEEDGVGVGAEYAGRKVLVGRVSIISSNCCRIASCACVLAYVG